MLSTQGQFTRRERVLPLPRRDREPKSYTDLAICPGCHAVRVKRTWSMDAALRQEVQRWKIPAAVLCPACSQARSHVPAGILHLQGTFGPRYRDEILRLLKNVEQASLAKNPLERILRIGDAAAGDLIVETSSEKLVRRLGRALHRAYHGRLEIRFSHENLFVRVYWRRDLDEPLP